jgi:hypothetical protein
VGEGERKEDGERGEGEVRGAEEELHYFRNS